MEKAPLPQDKGAMNARYRAAMGGQDLVAGVDLFSDERQVSWLTDLRTAAAFPARRYTRTRSSFVSSIPSPVEPVR